MGSGAWSKTAGKKPAASASRPSREPLEGSPPLSLRSTSPPFFSPGPLIVACVAPFARAAEDAARAPSTTSANTESRLIAAPFRSRCGVYNLRHGPVPLSDGRKGLQRPDRSLQTDARAEPVRPGGRRRRVGASDGRGGTDERSLEVGDEVVRRLEADRQADEAPRRGEGR